MRMYEDLVDLCDVSWTQNELESLMSRLCLALVTYYAEYLPSGVMCEILHKGRAVNRKAHSTRVTMVMHGEAPERCIC